jgi:hypothetical protein
MEQKRYNFFVKKKEMRKGLKMRKDPNLLLFSAVGVPA